MAKLWLGLGGLIVLLSGPVLAQDVWIDGQLELQALIPSSMNAGGPNKDSRLGLGPDSVINLEASVRDNLRLFWTFNVAKEANSRTAPLTVAPIMPSAREQFYAQLKGLSGGNSILKAGKFNVPFGLRSLDRQDKLIDLFDTGARLEWPGKQANLSATLVDGRLNAGQKYSRFFAGAEGKWGPVAGAVDVAGGNGRGLIGLGAEYSPLKELTLRGEVVDGDVESGGLPGGVVGQEVRVRSLYFDAAYQILGTPFTGTVKLRDIKFGHTDNTETKWGVLYKLDDNTTAQLEWWHNSINPLLDDGLVLGLKVKF